MGDRSAVVTPGQVVAGRYEVTRELGRGGMGQVVEAVNTVTGRNVALKIPHRDLSRDEQFRKRFLREARAASLLSHPNVIDILDVVVDDDRPVMVMELLEGRPLADELDRFGRLELEEAASYLVPVLDALRLAHDRGIVHRDFKPENIFLADEPAGGLVPKLLDFGIIKVVEGSDMDEPSRTTTGTMLGTPIYMAPEQVSGMRDVDHRADVWSAGAVAYECLSGRQPVSGDNFGQVFSAILTKAITPIAELAPELPADVCRAVTEALTKDRDLRPATLGPLIAALEPYVAGDVQRTTSLKVRSKRGPTPTPPSSGAGPRPGGDRTEVGLATTMRSDRPPPGPSGPGKVEDTLASRDVARRAAQPETLGGAHTDNVLTPMARPARAWPWAALVAGVLGVGYGAWRATGSGEPSGTPAAASSSAPSSQTAPSDRTAASQPTAGDDGAPPTASASPTASNSGSTRSSRATPRDTRLPGVSTAATTRDAPTASTNASAAPGTKRPAPKPTTDVPLIDVPEY